MPACALAMGSRADTVPLMPELPEVETVCRALQEELAGAHIRRLDLFAKGLRDPFPRNLPERVCGRQLSRIGRRAKYILMHLDNGDVLICHLGMSGRMAIHAQIPSERDRHDHVIFLFDDERALIFSDPRRFGSLDISREERLEDHPRLAGLGPEPLGNRFSAAVLAQSLHGRKTAIKQALLDQKTVAGLGNIYVCEALWRSGISPCRQATTLTEAEITDLHGHIRAVLNDAIAAGGSSLRDYRRASGEMGYFQHDFAVYGREGEDCRRPACPGRIERIAQAGRSSFFCPLCQH